MIGKYIEVVSFLTNENAKDPEKIWEVKEHKEKRSLSANAYFHVLCDKIRLKMGLSMAAVKNQMIADYGQIQYLPDGNPMYLKTTAPEDYMREQETVHTKLVRVAEEKDTEVFFYRVYRPSHTYNSAEFSKLIDGTVQEAKNLDIETLPPEEIRRMMNALEDKSLSDPEGR